MENLVVFLILLCVIGGAGFYIYIKKKKKKKCIGCPYAKECAEKCKCNAHQNR